MTRDGTHVVVMASDRRAFQKAAPRICEKLNVKRRNLIYVTDENDVHKLWGLGEDYQYVILTGWKFNWALYDEVSGGGRWVWVACED